MPEIGRMRLFVRCFSVAVVMVLAAWAATAQKPAEPQNPFYAQRNKLGVLVAYSGNSSHILEGQARNRELLNIGVSYNRRLTTNRLVNWQYSGEFFPVALESDPVQPITYTISSQNPPETLTGTISNPVVAPCRSFSGTFASTDGTTESLVATCTRRWTMGEALSPVGLQWNFLPAHRLQPFFVGHGGYMYSSDAIPAAGTGSFNFTFDLGAGLEFYRSRERSIRVEYRYHHISNAYLDQLNPGIDNGLVQVGYWFGLGRN